MTPDPPYPPLPARIRGLGDLAYNLWWSWQVEARNLFRDLGLQAWRASGHNPIRMLAILPPDVLKEAAADPEYLRRYDALMARMHEEIDNQQGWFSQNYGSATDPLAYMSAEYGLHSSLPTYAGGLGILAGDHLKECSDLGVPVVGVGLIYSAGYVQQRIREDGWQEDIETMLERTFDPIRPVLEETGKPVLVQVPVFDPPVYVTAWRVAVGRVALYLMGTDLEINQPWDQAIAQHLYASNPEQRLRQEIVLGMGGMRLLARLGVHPAALHINEGHPALAILERIRRGVQQGQTFDEAFHKVSATTAFTTHTPVAAGTDVYPFSLMEKYFGDYCQELKIESQTLLKLGINPQDPNAGFNMTVFALRAAKFSNAVSQRHGEVARKMWASLWPDKPQDGVPIASITNGVHLPTWIELVDLQPLLSQALGRSWIEAQDQAQVWKAVNQIDDEMLWSIHQRLKVMLISQINEQARRRWHDDRAAASSILAFGALLDPEILTIGFARRFTAYKRADLIFSDLARVQAMVNDPLRPIQFIFAGIAHPADTEGKRLIQRIVHLGQDPSFAGRIAFVEDYDQQLAQYLVHGVDVWLNNPLPPLEASGTSGMKAAVNGTPNLAILDGWWIEGYQQGNGWAFGSEPVEGDRTAGDAQAIYRLLEEEIIPRYYERTDDEIPHGFVRVMKQAIETTAPAFSARRMVKEYITRCYAEALSLKSTRPEG
jgi:starch phosphorylase